MIEKQLHESLDRYGSNVSLAKTKRVKRMSVDETTQKVVIFKNGGTSTKTMKKVHFINTVLSSLSYFKERGIVKPLPNQVDKEFLKTFKDDHYMTEVTMPLLRMFFKYNTP